METALLYVGLAAIALGLCVGVIHKSVDIIDRKSPDGVRRQYVRTTVSVFFLMIYVAYRRY